jgi:hypothetical protein
VHKGRYSYFLNDEKVRQTMLTDSDSKLLAQVLAGIDVVAIKDLQAPSKRHQFDGAMVTSVAITANGKTHRSVTFDDDNPPQALKALVDFLLTVR